MKEIFIGALTFEVALCLDKDLRKEMGKDYSSSEQHHRLAAILFTLRDSGVLHSCDRDRETWFYFNEGENLAEDVIRVPLTAVEMAKSLELAKRIENPLKRAWQKSDSLEKENFANLTDVQYCDFEVDSFVSQLAIWVDKEITLRRPEFAGFSRAERILEICGGLQSRNVAERRQSENRLVWTTSPKIDARVDGAVILGNDRFVLSSRTNARLLDQFKSEVRRHLKRRLKSMLETQEAFFQMYNAGDIKIDSIGPDGEYRWSLTAAGVERFREFEKQ